MIRNRLPLVPVDLVILLSIIVVPPGCSQTVEMQRAPVVPRGKDRQVYKIALTPPVFHVTGLSLFEDGVGDERFRDCHALVSFLCEQGNSLYEGNILITDACLELHGGWDSLTDYCMENDIDLFCSLSGSYWPCLAYWKVKSTRSHDVDSFVKYDPFLDIVDGGPQPNLTGRGVEPHFAEKVVYKALFTPNVVDITEFRMDSETEFRTPFYAFSNTHYLIEGLRDWGYALFKGKFLLTYVSPEPPEDMPMQPIADFCREHDIDLFVTTPEIKDQLWVTWEVKSSRADELEPFVVGPSRVAKAALAPTVVNITEAEKPEAGFVFEDQHYADCPALVSVLTEQHYTRYQGKILVTYVRSEETKAPGIDALVAFCLEHDIDLFVTGPVTTDKPYVIWKVRSTRGQELERFLYRPMN